MTIRFCKWDEMQRGALVVDGVKMEMIGQADTVVAMAMVEVVAMLGVQAATCSACWGLSKIVELLVAQRVLVRVGLPSCRRLHLLLPMNPLRLYSV